MIEKNPCLTFSSPADAEEVAAHSPQLERSTVILACFAALSEAAVPVSGGEKTGVSGAVRLQVEVKVVLLTLTVIKRDVVYKMNNGFSFN